LCSSLTTYSQLADGSYELGLVAVAADGTAGTPTYDDFTVDTSVPAAPLISAAPTAGGGVTLSWYYSGTALGYDPSYYLNSCVRSMGRPRLNRALRSLLGSSSPVAHWPRACTTSASSP
jgi:hypothetical protein